MTSWEDSSKTLYLTKQGTYRLKMDNLDVNSMDYYFVSGSIMYFEGERKNNNEIIVKHYTSGFPFVTYSIQEEFLRHYYIESSPYLWITK